MREQIPALIEKNIFLSEDIKSKILASYQSASDEKIAQIHELLNASLAKQQTLLAKALKNKPELLAQVKQEISGDFRKSLHEKEAASRAEEEKDLEGLENELNSLFE